MSAQIVLALFGAQDQSYNDVTKTVQDKVNAGQTAFTADDSDFGKDPAFGSKKALVIVWTGGAPAAKMGAWPGWNIGITLQPVDGTIPPNPITIH